MADLAHHYNMDVFAPAGLPLGDTYAIESPTGTLLQYGYDILGELGVVNVYLRTPGTSGDFGLSTSDLTEVRRTNVPVQGAPALLVHLRFQQEPRADMWRVIFPAGGQVIEVNGATAQEEGHDVTPGPDALLAVANALHRIPVGAVDSAGLLPKGPNVSGAHFEGQVSSVPDIAQAESLYGGAVRAPAAFSLIQVFHSGWLKSYTVDLDAQGTRRLFVMPGPIPPSSEATGHGVAAFQTVSVGGKAGVYEQVKTAAGAVSLLFFEAHSASFLLRDAAAGTAGDLLPLAESVVGESQQ